MVINMTILKELKEQFLVDSKGRKTAVVLDIAYPVCVPL